MLASEHVEIQLALWHQGADALLAALLGSDSRETQSWAQRALLHLAICTESRAAIVARLVSCLAGRSTSAQFKAAEALADLLERIPSARVTVAQEGAVAPLVQLLGNGQRADRNTPPERAAAVLAEVARLNESKGEIERAGGLAPLVTMLSSRSSQVHAACALWHMSMVASNKPILLGLGAVPLLVAILAHGDRRALHFSLSLLLQLASSSDAKARIVQAGSIPVLLALLQRFAAGGPPAAPPVAAAPPSAQLITAPSAGGAAAEGEVVPPSSASADGSVADGSVDSAAADGAGAADPEPVILALLSVLARDQKAYRTAIVQGGGLGAIMPLVCTSPPGPALHHAVGCLWGLAQEPRVRSRIAESAEVIERLLTLLTSEATGETQKMAASALVLLAQDEQGVAGLKLVGAASKLTTLKFLVDGWLRTQAVLVLELMGHGEAKRQGGGGGSMADVPRLGGSGAGVPLWGSPGSPRLQQRVLSNPSPLLEWYESPRGYMPTSPRVGGMVGGGGSGGPAMGKPESSLSETLLARWQAKLATKPELDWMLRGSKSGETGDNYMADLALGFRLKEPVVVETEEKAVREAIVQYIGRVPEIGRGYWIGVEFEAPEGKHDGSIGSVTYFEGRTGHGSFLRPNHIRRLGGPAAGASASPTKEALPGSPSSPTPKGKPSLKLKGTPKNGDGGARSQRGGRSQRSARASKESAGASRSPPGSKRTPPPSKEGGNGGAKPSKKGGGKKASFNSSRAQPAAAPLHKIDEGDQE